MSQTSKVSPALRQQILNTFKNLPTGTKLSNMFLMSSTQNAFSLRKIQEATQKLTNEGLLTKTRQYGITYYILTPQVSTPAPALSGTVGIAAAA